MGGSASGLDACMETCRCVHATKLSFRELVAKLRAHCWLLHAARIQTMFCCCDKRTRVAPQGRASMCSARRAMLMLVPLARILQQIARMRLQILVATVTRVFARYRCGFLHGATAPSACSRSMVLLPAGAKALIEGTSMAPTQTLRGVQSLFAASMPDALPAPPRQPQAKMQYPAQTNPADTPVVWRDSEGRPTESMVPLRIFARSYVCTTSKAYTSGEKVGAIISLPRHSIMPHIT